MSRTYINIKHLKLTALLLLSPSFFFAQSLTGLWTGSLSNDSNTIRKDQSYEIALTEYRGKVYGYSRNEFIVNDTLYYIVKRVKGIIDGDVCEVKDDEIISCNFRNKLDKGIKIINTFRLNKEDSSWNLDGKWKTLATKKYYALTGKAELNEEKDLAKSKIFPHLEELRLAKDVAFYKDQKKQDEKMQQPLDIKKEKPITIAPIEKKKPDDEVLQTIQTMETKERTVNKKDVSAPLNKTNNSISTPEIQKIKKPTIANIADTKDPNIYTNNAAALVNERRSEFTQSILIKSDSLQLALYDNGEIDGDTVSVLLNNEVIIARQCLKAIAFKKTIYIPKNLSDSTVLTLYAENLGKYPPNTGLLIVNDGDNSYRVRFSADLQTNAAVILRRKSQ